jgi:LPS-assembly lipoprotein
MNRSAAAQERLRNAALRDGAAGRSLRLLLVGVLAFALAACGFELRKPPEFAFKTIYANVAPTSVLGVELKRNLAALGNVHLITDAAQLKDAQVILDIVQELREKVVVGMTPAGQVREFQLRIRLRFKLRTPQGKELIPETEMLQQRDISFNESAVLSKEAEEGLLYRNMQTDIVQQLMRRLAAVKEL